MNKKIVIGIIILFLIVGAVVYKKHKTVQTSSAQDPNSVNLVSTSPSPLDESTILPTQTITLTFDHSAQNVPELRLKIDPQVDVKVELSGDRKTVKITPKTTFGLKAGYSIEIPSDAKFDPNTTLGHDVLFHFKTIDYTGV